MLHSLEEAVSKIDALREQVHRRIIGQDAVMDLIFVALFSSGANNHVLLEGVPGIAKTELLKAIAEATNVSFARIQMTPDMHPRDITGFDVPNPVTGEWTFRKGPIFTNFLLADELNRTPPKTASALLEAMQELHVTTESQGTLSLPQPFMVFATQNPIEQEGTYILAEAQKDRFLMKVHVGYPTRDEELMIARIIDMAPIDPVMSGEDILSIRKNIFDHVYIAPSLEETIIQIVRLTRPQEQFSASHTVLAVGASPRAAIALRRSSLARALLKRRGYVTPDDIISVAFPVLNHRVIFSHSVRPQERNIVFEELLYSIINTVFSPSEYDANTT